MPSRVASKKKANIKLSEQIYHLLKRDIIECVYEPGQTLQESAVRETYKIGHTPFRLTYGRWVCRTSEKTPTCYRRATAMRSRLRSSRCPRLSPRMAKSVARTDETAARSHAGHSGAG